MTSPRRARLSVLVATTLAVSASGLVLAASPNYACLFLAAAVAGLGNSVFHPADFTLLNRRVSAPRLGHAFSVHGLSGSLGWAAAPVFVLAIAETSGWRAAGIGASIVIVGVLCSLACGYLSLIARFMV